MNVPLWWFLARASGIVSWFAMGASLVLGVVLTTRLFPERRRPAWLLDVHRWSSGIGAVALAVHLAALVADSYLRFGPVELAVPFASDWRPGAVALGVVSVWLYALVAGTALVRRRLPRRLWKGLHRFAYLAFWFSALHAATAGSDTGNPLYRLAAVGLLTAVVFVTVYRVAVTEPPPRRSASRAVRSGDRPPVSA